MAVHVVMLLTKRLVRSHASPSAFIGAVMDGTLRLRRGLLLGNDCRSAPLVAYPISPSSQPIGLYALAPRGSCPKVLEPVKDAFRG